MDKFRCRLIFFGTSAGLGAIVLTLVSLFPKLLEKGLYYATGGKLEKDENVNDERQNESDLIDNEDAISHKSIRSGKCGRIQRTFWSGGLFDPA